MTTMRRCPSGCLHMGEHALPHTLIQGRFSRHVLQDVVHKEAFCDDEFTMCRVALLPHPEPSVASGNSEKTTDVEHTWT